MLDHTRLDPIPYQNVDNAPSPDDVRSALERIMSSSEFRASPHLAAFLRFSVEKSLAGEGSFIKAYSIATGVLGRPPTFDPQADPIVRVEATRLRRALERYYVHEGADDPIKIDIPRGRYISYFSFSTPAASVAPQDNLNHDEADGRSAITSMSQSHAIWTRAGLQATWQNLGRSEQRSIGVFACALVGALITWTIMPMLDQSRKPIEQAFILQPAQITSSIEATQTVTHSTSPASNRIIFAMLQLSPLTVHPEHSEATNLSKRMIELIASRVRDFEGIPVIDPDMPSANIPTSNHLYVLSGTILENAEQRDKFEVNLRLIHQPSHEIIWTHDVSLDRTTALTDSKLKTISNEIVQSLTGLNGAIRVDDARRHRDNLAEASPCQICLADSEIALRTENPDLITKSIACLSALSERNPDEPLLFKQLAALNLIQAKQHAEAMPSVTLSIAQLKEALALDPTDRNTQQQLEALQAQHSGLASPRF